MNMFIFSSFRANRKKEMYCCVRYNKQNARKDSVLPVIFSCVRGGSCPHIMKPSFSCHYACHARLISLDDLPLCEILEGHYSGTFVSMAFYHDAVHSRSRPVSGQCVGDPHGFPALLEIKINRLHSALHLQFNVLIRSLKRKGKVTFTDYCETLISRSAKRADYNPPRSGQLTKSLFIQFFFWRRKKMVHILLRV